jgi:hypothetical protein
MICLISFLAVSFPAISLKRIPVSDNTSIFPLFKERKSEKLGF